jgi:hypothetical protein
VQVRDLFPPPEHEVLSTLYYVLYYPYPERRLLY